jgi:general secretion pathway protein N
MKVANQRLPTLLLAAFALWCLLVLVVVYAGLGGRYSLHPDDASRVPTLPQLDLSRAQTPLGGLTDYAQVGERPLFNSDRRPIPVPAAPGGPPDAPTDVPLDVVLTSVILSGDNKIAIVLDKKTNKSQSVKLGAALAGEQSAYKLIELEARKAVFEGPSGRTEAALRVFDGQGGEAPTAIVEAPVDPNVAAQPAVPAQPTQDAQATAGLNNAANQAQTPESRAELIRRRIEERRRQMREEAERANQQNGQKQ